jgi:hypothetical protein
MTKAVRCCLVADRPAESFVSVISIDGISSRWTCTRCSVSCGCSSRSDVGAAADPHEASCPHPPRPAGWRRADRFARAVGDSDYATTHEFPLVNPGNDTDMALAGRLISRTGHRGQATMRSERGAALPVNHRSIADQHPGWVMRDVKPVAADQPRDRAGAAHGVGEMS